MRQLIRVAVLMLTASLCLAAVSQAANVKRYNLSGSLLSTRGTATVPVTGAIPVRAGAFAYQITGGTQPQNTLLLPRNQVGQTFGPFEIPIPPVPTFQQLKTDLIFSFPGTPVRNVPLEQNRAKFAVGGRSGPATLSFCPAATETGKTVFSGVAPYNPACTNTAGPAGTPPGEGFFAGQLKYTNTLNALQNQMGNQFGGRAQQLIAGAGSTVVGPNGTLYGGDVAFYANTAMSLIGFNLVRAGIDGEHTGIAFGQTNLVSHLAGKIHVFLGPALTPNQLLTPAMIGSEVATVPTGMSLGYGGPFATDMLNVNKPDAAGAPQFFTLSGSDARTAGGEGNLVLVAGAIIGNQIGGGQGRGEQGVLTLNFSNAVSLPEPSATAGAAAALLALAGLRRFVRRRSS